MTIEQTRSKIAEIVNQMNLRRTDLWTLRNNWTKRWTGRFRG